MVSVGSQHGKSLLAVHGSTMSKKLRERETLGFRPENAAQEKLILDAQAAVGIKMSDLLRRAVLVGLPRVVAEAQEQQRESFAKFEASLRETTGKPAVSTPTSEPDTNVYPNPRKPRKHGTPTNS